MTMDFATLAEHAAARDPAVAAIPRAHALTVARNEAQSLWRRIRTRHAAGESGGNVVRLLAEAADRIVRMIFDVALCQRLPAADRLKNRVAICGLGGYGRAEVSPCSDLDLCLLFQGRLDDAIEALNGYLMPFFWDMGFRSGLVVQRAREAAALAARDPEVFTAYSQARLIAGSGRVFARLQFHINGIAARGARHAVAHIEGRTDPDSLPEAHRDLFAPEPDLKQNAGGLRDFHAAQWLYQIRYGTSSLDALASLGVLQPDTHLDLLDALDFLWRLRNELHFHTGQPRDRLTYAMQAHAAQAFEYAHDGEPGVERLMQDYYRAARRVRQFFLRAAAHCGAEGQAGPDAAPEATAAGTEQAPIMVRNGKLFATSTDTHWFAEHPARLMEVFWHAARNGVPLSPRTEAQVSANLSLVNDAFRASDLVRHFFLAICNRPARAGTALRQMADCGLLGAYLPEFAAVRDIVRYEDFHHYPVDEHTLRAVEALAGIASVPGAIGRVLVRALEELAEPRLLVLAILLHDLGKAGGEAHVAEGARLAARICARIGMSPGDAERVTFLVRHHLLMTHYGMYRDTDDMDIVHRFARIMRSGERLRALLLLTHADLTAVGPNVWNDWKGALLLKLYLRTERVLSGRAPASGESFSELPKTEAAAEAAGLDAPGRAALRVYLNALGERYYHAFGAHLIAGHFLCLRDAREEGFALRCFQAEDTGTSELVVCTRDQPGLFARIAGCFTANLADINAAALFTLPDGWVVDCFTASDAARGRALTAAQVRGVERMLRAALLEQADVAPQVERARRRIFGLLQPRTPARTIIAFDNDSSQTDTVVDLETGDRTGLLYDIACAFASVNADLRTARIITDARRVRDAFYIRQCNAKITSADAQAAVRGALEQAIQGPVMAESKGGTR